MHEALLWMGYATGNEAERSGMERRGSTSYARRDARSACPTLTAMRWFATEATRDPEAVLRGRLERSGTGAVASDHAAGKDALAVLPAIDRDRRAEPLLALEAHGVVLRCRIARHPGVVRAASARAHPSLHAGAAAPRDRAGHRDRFLALPLVLAARRSRLPARRSARRARGGAQARGLRGARPSSGSRASCASVSTIRGPSGSISSRSPAR